MSQMYIASFVIAIVIFVAIVAYSVWQKRDGLEFRSRRYKDPLLHGSNDKVESVPAALPAVEKKLNANDNASETEVEITDNSSLDADDVEFTIEFDEDSDPPKKVEGSSRIVMELVARIKNKEPIEQHDLLGVFRKHDFKFHRHVHIYGLNELTDLWRDIEMELPSARFVALGVSIQLADREGPISAKEVHDFQQMTLDFSNHFNAPFEFSMEIDEATKQAKILDGIVRRYDAMAVLNVVAKDKAGFRMADIESCARDLQMTTDRNGIFIKIKGQKKAPSILYRLACTDGTGHWGVRQNTDSAIHDLVMYMNVPATEEPDYVFQDMVADANSLSTWLDGRVVNRAGKVMTQRSYSVLTQQIADISYAMKQEGLVPGDESCRKLF